MTKTINKLFIISGPSGVGKTTVAKRLLKTMPELKTSVTYTTRPKRLGKKEDKPVIYVDEDEFRRKIEAGDFVEWAMVHDNFYGTDKKTLLDSLENNNILMNIDVQGGLQIKNKFPDQTVLIFIKTKSLSELAQRILKRESMSQAILNLRLNQSAKKELALAKKYDHVVFNEKNKVSAAVDKIIAIIGSNA